MVIIRMEQGIRKGIKSHKTISKVSSLFERACYSNEDVIHKGLRIRDAGHSKADCDKQKARLREMKAHILLKIKGREMKICEIQRSAELSRESAERQTADKDNQTFPQDLKTCNLTQVTFIQPSYGESVMTSVNKLKEILDGEKEKFLSKAKLIRMQQFAVDVTLNPNTAHPNLILSEDGKQVHCSDAKQNLPDNPERFSTAVNVLGRQSFSSGRFYYEVQVRGKTTWDLGVVYKSIGRKGSIKTSPDDGLWAICLRGGNTFKAAGLSWSVKTAVNKVGVFVDYEKGLVSFSDVDSAELIHRYRDCSFKDDLHPFFSPGIYHGGLNSTPLVISPLGSAAPPLSAP
ncbi:hypothetical protein XENOCAPTIV_022529 [Xenoophorus captivus]|uniref:B30.2/SPRY domain-containing protein n=1 Tax=Xenoophorus captivus TaxID=1517983 RepID=A0ABV0RT02_9TELE